MLNLAIVNDNYEKINRVGEIKVLIIAERLEAQAFLIEKCIDAGVKAQNILNHNNAGNIRDYITDDITHVIIDAHLYNYLVSNILNKFIDEKTLSILIYHGEDEVKTIRLITDNRLMHINKMTTAMLLKKLLEE